MKTRLTSKDKLYIIKPIEIVGNTKIPAEAQHNGNRNAKASAFLFEIKGERNVKSVFKNRTITWKRSTR